MKKIFLFLLSAFSVLPFFPCSLSADDIFLKNGGKLSGKILADDAEIRVTMPDGITVTVAREQLDSISLPATAGEYEKMLAETPDTMAGHLELAQWCKDNGLVSRQKIHLNRVLELEPNNAVARAKLGYTRGVDGEWRTAEGHLADQGKVRGVGGQVKTTQEKELQEAKKAAKIEETAFTKQIALQQKALGGKKHEEAVAYFNTLISERAVPGLMKAYDSEKWDFAKKLYINALARIGGPQATRTLMIVAVNEPNEDLRLTAVDHLRSKKEKDAVTYLITRLSPKTSTNEQVNHAAVALGEMGDRTAVPALIDALNTVHKFQVSSGSGGQTSATFPTGGGGGGGLSMGGGPKIVQKQFQNPEVLKALEKLTGVNFLYDRAKWIAWLQNQPV